MKLRRLKKLQSKKFRLWRAHQAPRRLGEMFPHWVVRSVKLIRGPRKPEDSLRIQALKTAVQVGLADSTAGKYIDFNSSKSLAKHLKSLETKASK